MSELKVKLINHTPNPERMVAVAARLCYAPVGGEDLFSNLSQDEIEKLVRFVVKSGHLSTTEHISFTFAIEGVSRALTHQLVRHRIASYSQQSQRYVMFKDNFDYITPKAIEKNKLAREVFKDFIKISKETYDKLISLGIDKEDARYVLPNASETKIIVTMNARELLHFFSLRLCRRAQWEIREMAKLMLKRVRQVCPIIFEDAGPDCIRTKCSEGEMSCGKSKEVKKELKNL